ncbi:hypothetical protein MPTK1_8g13680 [Marchantia polymorpha subsp. ruderalis]|uniref:YDG domain-containing protein n=2 Tax=Marchantia polymorpha TaxID=3197 RepID=A0A176W6Z4_MARPO|nr:hypothetical protein AXG93_115s1840 [Marchantia polymorpha subsp. ruderalis]PTQ31558.1 hypothetical protein MARPO_0110s0047 [Marchantia polymorpha]BBN19789.1 hypothetical protein Mp_8g13680 [Marchantia polymorpha subsp. ruderalis]|eukprot:PTQ31558.1 hypothetical protein MARPO_0110s0047 [Marchantia polymorpha]
MDSIGCVDGSMQRTMMSLGKHVLQKRALEIRKDGGIISRHFKNDGSRRKTGFTELLLSVQGVKRALPILNPKRNSQKVTFSELLRRVHGGLAASVSSDHVSTIIIPPTTPDPSTGWPLASPSSVVTLGPQQLPTNFMGSGYMSAEESPGMIYPSRLPSLSQHMIESSTFSAGETTEDLENTMATSRRNAQSDHFTDSKPPVSCLDLMPHRHSQNSRKDSRCNVAVDAPAGHDEQFPLIDMEQLAVDLEYDVYDDFMLEDAYRDEDPDEFYDYRMDYANITKRSQLDDQESQELPSWWCAEEASSKKTLFDVNLPPDRAESADGYVEHVKHLGVKGPQEDEPVNVHRETTCPQRRCNELLPCGVRVKSEGGDERGPMMHHEDSTKRQRLDIDMERALKLVQHSETFKESLKALRDYTEASKDRGCFFLPQVLAVGKLEKENAIVPKFCSALLTRKPKPVELEFPDSRDFDRALFPIKVEVTSDARDLVSWKEWHRALKSSNEDLEYNWKVQAALKTLERVWTKITKDQDKDRNQLSTDKNSPNNLHLRIASRLRRDGLWLHEEKRPLGHCPGVPVGACFIYRIEMALIGLHRALQSGIAVVPADRSPYGRPVASSVVFLGSKGVYQDDQDMGGKIIYSGHGGLICGKKSEYQDQKLERGNLALSNSFELKVPVRVIRGHRFHNSRSGRLYSYDGLYRVTKVDYQTGVHGNKVYLFTMVRIPGQGPIPVATRSALLYKGEPDTDHYYPSRARRSRNRRIRGSQGRLAASGSRSTTCKPEFTTTGDEMAMLPPAHISEKVSTSVPYSGSVPSLSQFAIPQQDFAEKFLRTPKVERI